MAEQIKGLKPLFLVKPGTITRKDIARAERLAGICIVECADPDSARYQELPITYDVSDQARAALSLMRKVITSPTVDFKRGDLTRWFIEQLLSWQVPDEVKRVQATR